MTNISWPYHTFFTDPQPFTATVEHINTAQDFYNTVVSSGKLSIFENTPAITVFIPINGIYTSCNPEAHIITGRESLYYSPDLFPGTSVNATSGDVIGITLAPNGERLVNNRRLVQPNVPIKNGVLHFIDGVCTS